MDPLPETRLLALPPEIRCSIYGFVLAANTFSKVALLEAKAVAPSAALLFTCRLVHMEAVDTYDSDAKAFWSSTVFFVDAAAEIAKGSNPSSLVRGIPLQALSRITRLDLVEDLDGKAFTLDMMSEYNVSHRLQTKEHY